VLRQQYSYNNGPFLAGLRGMGFQMPQNAFANYPNTMTSLASCLNMDYLENLVAGEDVASATVGDVADLCHNNRLYEFLHKQGYTVLAFSPGLAMREPRSTVDVCLAPALALNEFEMVLLSRVAPGRVVQACYHFTHGRASYWSYAFLRRRVTYLFDELERIAGEASSEPRLVYAQLTIPGPPFLFDREGHWSAPSQVTQRVFSDTFRGTHAEFRERYRAQLHYTNLLLEQCLRRLVANSTRPAVVVLASDHGPLLRVNRAGMDEAARKEQFGTLMAVRLPEGSKAELWGQGQTMSLVNLFRVTLNSVFGANLELLPDKTFRSSAEKPFETVPLPLSP
jgi:hypothetical protein